MSFLVVIVEHCWFQYLYHVGKSRQYYSRVAFFFFVWFVLINARSGSCCKVDRCQCHAITYKPLMNLSLVRGLLLHMPPKFVDVLITMPSSPQMCPLLNTPWSHTYTWASSQWWMCDYREHYNIDKTRSNIQCLIQCASIILRSITSGVDKYFPQAISTGFWWRALITAKVLNDTMIKQLREWGRSSSNYRSLRRNGYRSCRRTRDVSGKLQQKTGWGCQARDIWTSRAFLPTCAKCTNSSPGAIVFVPREWTYSEEILSFAPRGQPRRGY